LSTNVLNKFHLATEGIARLNAMHKK
jgi:hypothetical protein